MASQFRSGDRTLAALMFRLMVVRSVVSSLAVLMAMVVCQLAHSQGTTTSSTTTTYADGATKSQDTTTTAADGTKLSETETEYDEDGRPTSETQTIFDGKGHPVSEHKKTWVYDDKGRLIYFESSDETYGDGVTGGVKSGYRVRKKYKDDQDTEGTTTSEQEYSSVTGKWRDFDGDGGDVEPSKEPLQPAPPKPVKKPRSVPPIANAPLGEEPPASGTQTPEKPKSAPPIENTPLGEEPPASGTQTPGTPPPPTGAGGKTSNAVPAEQKTIAIVLPANAQPGDTITGTATDDPTEIAEMQTIPAFHITLVPVPQSAPQTATTVAQPAPAASTPVPQASSTQASQASGDDTLAGLVVVVNGTKQPADKPLVAVLGPAAESIAVELLTNVAEPKVIGQDSVPVSAAAPSPAVPTEAGSTETGPTPPTGSSGTTAPEDYDMPPVAKPGAVEVIHGPVSGNANDMQIAVDGEPTKILTATPRAVFWRVPADLPATPQGTAHTVVFTHGDAAGGAPKSVTLPLYGVEIKMSEGSSNLIKGQSTPVQVTVSIPQNLPASAWQSGTPPSDLVDLKTLESGKSGVKPPKPTEEGFIVVLIENETPEVVRLGKTDSIVLQLHQKNFTDGSYTYNTTLDTIHAGAYVVRARVVAFLKAAQGQASMSSGN